MDEWKILRPATVVWSNEWLKVQEYSVLLPTGVETQFYAVETNDGVAVLAVDEQNYAILNRQFRPALGRVITELPAGSIEKGENLIDAACREMAEEAGLIIGDLQYLGRFYRNPAKDTGSMYIYFARVINSTTPHQEIYEYMETIRIPLAELINQVINNEIQDITTTFAVLMLQSQLARGDIRI